MHIFKHTIHICKINKHKLEATQQQIATCLKETAEKYYSFDEVELLITIKFSKNNCNSESKD